MHFFKVLGKVCAISEFESVMITNPQKSHLARYIHEVVMPYIALILILCNIILFLYNFYD